MTPTELQKPLVTKALILSLCMTINTGLSHSAVKSPMKRLRLIFPDENLPSKIPSTPAGKVKVLRILDKWCDDSGFSSPVLKSTITRLEQQIRG